MDRESIISKVKIKLDEVTPPGVDLPFDDFIGPILDECAKEIANVCPLHLLSPASMISSSFNHWFLPSVDDSEQMYLNLHLFSIGGFLNISYPTSSEFDATNIWTFGFHNGAKYNGLDKSLTNRFRPCRSFIASIGAYSLRDIGPAGGWIYYIVGTTYYEAHTVDINITNPISWSNIQNAAIGTTGTAIGTGQANTTAIINQVGHTDSAAKLCDDLVSVETESTLNLIFVNNKCYIPKPADFLRLYEIKFPLWVKSVRETTKPDSDAGKIQDNPYLSSGIGRPTVIIMTTMPAGGSLREYLVCGKVAASALPIALYVKIPKPEDLPDQLLDSLTWLCSAKVLIISGRGDLAQGAMSQYQSALTQLSKT